VDTLGLVLIGLIGWGTASIVATVAFLWWLRRGRRFPMPLRDCYDDGQEDAFQGYPPEYDGSDWSDGPESCAQTYIQGYAAQVEIQGGRRDL
jgi:hypothetical protein